MKPQFNKTWLWIAIIIIGNIFIFRLFSNKFESYVAESMVEQTEGLNN